VAVTPPESPCIYIAESSLNTNEQEEGTPYDTKLINNDTVKSRSGIVCTAIDYLKKRVLPGDGPVSLKHVVT
jgi:hypothetical protein